MAADPYKYDGNGRLVATPGAAPGTPGSADPTATPPSPTPAAPTPPSTTSGGGYYPRTGSDIISAPTPQSVEEVQLAKTKAAQAQIDSLNSYYASLSSEQTLTNDKNDRSTSAISTLSGLAGSTEADVAQRDTSAKGRQALDKIANEKSVAIQGILSKIRDDAVTEARQQRLDYNQGLTDSIANRAATQKQAVDHITNLTAAGVTADGLKSSDPTSYAHLLSAYAGDEGALKGAFILNTPKNQILTSSVVNGSLVIARENPITHAITHDTVDLGLPKGSVQVADAGGYLLFGKAGADGKWDGDMSSTTKINKTLSPADTLKNGTTGPYVAGANPTVDSWAERIQSGAAKITDIPSSQASLRSAVTVALTAQGNQLSGKPTTTELGLAAKTTAQGLLDKFNNRQGTGAVGGSSLFNFATLPGTDKANFINDFNTLKSQLSLEGVKYLKGQGAVSDSERALLASAVTKLNLSQSEDEFKTTLQGIIDKLNGNAADTSASPPKGTDGASHGFPGYHSDGTQWVPN